MSLKKDISTQGMPPTETSIQSTISDNVDFKDKLHQAYLECIYDRKVSAGLNYIASRLLNFHVLREVYGAL
jgi:hypothetical protein